MVRLTEEGGRTLFVITSPGVKKTNKEKGWRKSGQIALLSIQISAWPWAERKAASILK